MQWWHSNGSLLLAQGIDLFSISFSF